MGSMHWASTVSQKRSLAVFQDWIIAFKLASPHLGAHPPWLTTTFCPSRKISSSGPSLFVPLLEETEKRSFQVFQRRQHTSKPHLQMLRNPFLNTTPQNNSWISVTKVLHRFAWKPMNLDISLCNRHRWWGVPNWGVRIHRYRTKPGHRNMLQAANAISSIWKGVKDQWSHLKPEHCQYTSFGKDILFFLFFFFANLFQLNIMDSFSHSKCKARLKTHVRRFAEAYPQLMCISEGIFPYPSHPEKENPAVSFFHSKGSVHIALHFQCWSCR